MDKAVYLLAIRNNWRRVILLALAFVLVVGDSHSTAYAAYSYTNKLIQDQFWYDECAAGGGGSSGSGTGTLQGSDNAQKVWNYFKEKGYSDEQVAGIMGNLAWESGDPTFNKATDSEELSGGGGYGLAQWTGGRRTALVSTAKSNGKEVTDLQYQLDYLYNEMQTRIERDGGSRNHGGGSSKTEDQGIREQKTVEDATEYFMYNFERPGAPHLDKRIDYAKQYLAKYGTGDSSANQATSSSSGSSSSSSANCASGGGPGGTGAQCGEGGFYGTLRCYAWPQYKGSGFTEAMPEYTTATERAKAEGRYIGSQSYPGIDCGGFITTFMVDSGYEPGYNYGGMTSQGAGYTANQYEWTSKNWTTLGNGSEINVADLKPGDVANDRNNHTFMWVGRVEGFQPTNIASASLDDRAPMAGTENPADGDMTWFGKR